jgi:4-hydroxybenzoate polyprenyltransferase
MPAIGATVRSRWVAVRVFGSRIFKFAGAWAVPLLALVFYILTILYALRSKAVSSVSIFGSSPNYPLRTLSGLSISTTHILLAAMIFQSFNSLRLWKIVRRGLAYHEDLALQGESSKKGLLTLLFGCKTANWRARLWSILRLIAMVLPSVLNFLLMSKPVSHPLAVYANRSKLMFKS